jgi:thiaminase/transcriptional activator TenA
MNGPDMPTPHESVSWRLRRLADPIWQAQLVHPFVRGISDGSLDPDLFAVWLRQDYLFLLDYARIFAFAAARAPDEATMSRFATLMQETLHGEMALHRSYVAEFGITVANLAHETKAPTTQGYTDFLLHTAATADAAEVYAALLPCMWGYSWLGQRLVADGEPDDERYARWITSYASAEFAELAAWCRELVDTAAATLGIPAMERVEAAFLTSSRYELAFWDMAWRRETWSAATGDA